MPVKELINVVSMFQEIVLMGIGVLIELFVGMWIPLFIIDGIKAKSQHRKRKVGITVMFIISIILNVLAFFLVICFFAVLYMTARGIPAPFTWPWFA